jgi:hypothetical protein
MRTYKSDHYKNSKGEQIEFKVLVYTRPNLRDGVGEMLMYRGKTILEIMFDKCKVDPDITCIDMEYPERWANILELRAIPNRMLACFPNLKQVLIKTHSVYIIQCVHSEHIGICDDPSKYPEKDYADINTRYCDGPEQFTGLWTMTPSTGLKKVHP